MVTPRRRRRLGVRLIGFSMCALAIAWVLLSLYILRDERSSLERDLRAEGERLAAATAELCVEHLLVRDYPVLETQLTKTVGRVPDVAWARVTLPDGRVVAEATGEASPGSPGDGAIFSFRHDVVVSGISVPIGEMALGLSTASLEQRLARRRVQLGTGALATFSLLALVLATLMSRWVATPLRHLHRQADALAAGDLDSEVVLDARNELGDLATTLDAMRRRLQSSRSEIQQQNQELREARDELERRVEERSSELADAQKSLAQAERLAAIGQLAGGIGHEINNPLTFLILNVEEVLSELEGSQNELSSGWRREAIRKLRIAMDGANRIGMIVKDLRVHAGPGEDGGRGPADVGEAIATAVSLTRNEVKHRALLEIECGALPAAAADEGRIVQVLVNLIVNAARSIPPGYAAENRIDVRARADAEWVEIQVLDTGSGIADEIRSHVFEPFFTTHRHGEGTGLGLSICRAIVESFGGQIELTPRERAGTVASVRLPIAESVESAAPRRAESAPPEDRSASGGGRVLVIDDETQLGRVMQFALKGHEVTLATSGREALEVLTASPDFDAIFCDLMMADVTGMELYPQVCERWPELADAFIFMTGGVFTSAAQEFVETVAQVLLAKPFRRADVLAALEAVRRSRREADAKSD